MTEQTAPRSEVGDDPAPIECNIATAKHDLMKICLDELKQAQKPFALLTQDQQDHIIQRLDYNVSSYTRKLVTDIAANGKEPIPATLKNITAEDVLKGTILMSKHIDGKILSALVGKCNGGKVLVTLVDPEGLTEQTHGHKAQKSQGDLLPVPEVEDGDMTKVKAFCVALEGAENASDAPAAHEDDAPIDGLVDELREAGFLATPVQIRRWSADKMEAVTKFLDMPPSKRTPAATPEFLTMYRA